MIKQIHLNNDYAIDLPTSVRLHKQSDTVPADLCYKLKMTMMSDHLNIFFLDRQSKWFIDISFFLVFAFVSCCLINYSRASATDYR